MSESAPQEVLDLIPLAPEPEIRARQYRVGTQHGLQPLALSDRLERLGGSRLGDVVLDLSPEDLRAWLADSNAS